VRDGAGVTVGHLAWLGHRVTGVALALYLLPHFLTIGSARQGQAAFDAALGVFAAPLFQLAEWTLVTAVAFHLFNGLRVIALDAFALSGRQKLLFWLVMAATATVFLAASLLFVPKILAPA
jgi:succinate dehydrogenase cytochrome b556 subunit